MSPTTIFLIDIAMMLFTFCIGAIFGALTYAWYLSKSEAARFSDWCSKCCGIRSFAAHTNTCIVCDSPCEFDFEVRDHRIQSVPDRALLPVTPSLKGEPHAWPRY